MKTFDGKKIIMGDETAIVDIDEYKELLETKGRYLELKRLWDEVVRGKDSNVKSNLFRLPITKKTDFDLEEGDIQ